MRFLSRTSLATRLSVLVILTAIPLFVLLIVNYLEARSERRENGVAEARTYIRNIANQLDAGARDIDSFMSAAALNIGNSSAEINTPEMARYLASLQSRYDNLDYLFITDLNGNVIVQSSGEQSSINLSSRPYFQNLKGGAEKTWTTQKGLQSGELIAAYARVVPWPDSSARAYLVAAFKPANTVGNRPPGFPDDGNLFILDGNGYLIVSYSEPEVSIDPRDVSEAPGIAEALTGKSIDIENSDTPFDPDKRYGAYVPVPQLGWVIGYTRSQAVLDSQVQDRLVRDLGLLIGITAVTIAVLVFIARRMVSPLSKLATAAEEIAEGRRTAVDMSGADPDVRRLETAFAAMNTAVAEREDRLRDQARVLSTLEQVGSRIASDLNFESTVTAVTDAGTELTEAQFGAFFYNVVDERGESYQLYTISGIDPANFDGFPMPRNTEVFASTFEGSVLRLDDVTQDPRYGKNPPHHGMPEGHLPVRSYLAVPVISANGNVMGGLFFGHEEPARFTDRHETLAVGIAAWAAIALDNARLYTEAQEVQEQLRRANAAKDEFLGLVSHELRTPTTTIYGGIRMLDSRRQLLGPEATDELIHTMSEETERLVRLIENLLVFARLELGRMPDREPVALNALAEQVVRGFSRTHRNRQIETNLEAGLPQVLAQSATIEQVVTNYLSNADKYSPAGEPITLTTRRSNGSVELLVRDNGNGVNPDELPKIFESFYRSADATRVATGHGMGLSVSKKIIDAHKGRIFARNVEGGGFEIGFALPLADAASTDETPDATEPVSVGGSA